MNETGIDFRSLVIACALIAFVFVIRYSEARRIERRARITSALETLVAEVVR